ncbi:MAG TPA: glycosyltransferase family 1 protein [Ignavibacteriaceae bacterium]|nr:glycosyltransferase family 1 protein [Ignavibacteriaceae bacterium]
MKVCIDARYVFPKMDGIGRYLINLIDKLSEITVSDENIQFYILEIEKFAEKSVLRKFDERKNITFIKVPVFPQTIKNHFVGKYFKHLKIDIYHYPQFDLPWFISGAKIVTSILDMNPQKLKEFFPTKLGWIKRYYSILTNWVALKKSDLIITISKNTRDELISFYNYKLPEKIRQVYLGVDERFRQISCENTEDDRLKLLQTKYKFNRYFLYVGNNRPHKNLSRVLKAFKLVVKKSNQGLKFVLVGRQLENNLDIKTIVKEQNLIDFVIFIEINDEDLTSLYSGADAFIFCSLSEGFGLPILEAMAQGTPVITSNISSMKEIADGVGVLVNPYSIEDIEQKMLHVINNEDFRNQLSYNGLEHVKQFTWEKCAQKTLAIYKELLK